MFKLDLEKVKEPEVKSPTPAGSWRKQGNSRKTPTSASLTTLMHSTLWKILKEMGILDHLTSLLRSLYAGLELEATELTFRTGQGTMDWFKTWKGVWQGVLSSCLFSLYVEYIMQDARLGESQAGIKIAGRNINNLRYIHKTKCLY